MATTFNEAVSRAPLRPFQWMTFIVCLAVLVSDGIDLQLLGLIAPVIVAEWGVDRGSFGLAMSAALAGMAVGAWGGGWVGDRLGRRNVLAGAALLFGLATIGASQADTIPGMAAWRLAGGLGFGAAFPNALALTSEWLPDRWRSYAITALSVGTPIGGSIAAAVSPALLAELGWRGAFVFFGALTLLFVFVVLGLLRDSPQYLFQKGQPDRARAHARKVLPADIEIEPEGDGANPDAQGGAKVGVFHASHKRLNLGVAMAFSASTLVMFGMISWLTSFLTAAGLTLEQALKAGISGGLASIVGSLTAGYLTRRFGTRPVMLCAGVALVASIVSFATLLETLPAQPAPGHLWTINVLVAVMIGIVSIAISTIYVIMTLGYPQSCRGAGIGFGMLTGRIGGVLASFGGGFLLDLGQGSLIPFFGVLTAAAITVTLASLVIDRHVPAAGKA